MIDGNIITDRERNKNLEKMCDIQTADERTKREKCKTGSRT